MAQEIGTSLAVALVFAAMAACNGDSNNAPPQTPADQTMTTGASTANQYQSAPPQPATPPDSLGTASSTPQSTMAQNPAMNGATAGGAGGNGPQMGGPSASNGPGVSASGSNSPGGATDTASLDDPKIVAVIQAADTGEIEQAREALSKAKNGRVRHFAQQMLTDHSAAEVKISSIDGKAGITPQTSSVSEKMTSNGAQVIADLKSAAGPSFDKTYIDAQVDEHIKVLDCLDNKLLPRAQNSDLVKTLQDIRSKVASHLKDAQDIQGSLK